MHDEPAASTYYNVNALNQYERVERPYVPSEYDAVFPAFAQRLTYDADGNLSLVEKFGDANCDGVVNNFDIDDFVLAILHPNATDDVGESPPYQLAPPTGYTGNNTCWNERHEWADIDGDGNLDNFDINTYVAITLNPSDAQAAVKFQRYAWDAENRLVAVEPYFSTRANGDLRWKYSYDYLGRRVEKAVFQWVDDSWHEDEPVSVTRFVYDGWNVIEVLDATESGDPVVIRKQTWGFPVVLQCQESRIGALELAFGLVGIGLGAGFKKSDRGLSAGRGFVRHCNVGRDTLARRRWVSDQ